MFGGTEERNKLVIDLYLEHKNISEVVRITKLNYRTVRTILVNNEIDIAKNNPRLEKPITIVDGEENFTFKSISAAARYFHRLEVREKDRLLSNIDTIQYGLDYKVRQLDTHRRNIRRALNEAILYDNRWTVTSFE